MDEIISYIYCDEAVVCRCAESDEIDLCQPGEKISISKQGAAELIKVLQEWIEND